MHHTLLLCKSQVAEPLSREWEICIQFFHVPEKIQTCTFYSSGVSNKQAGPSGVLVLPKGYPLGTNVGVYLIS